MLRQHVAVGTSMEEKTRIAAASGGALTLSTLAAAFGLCCTVPWAVTLLGVGGAVVFARLAFLLPYAIIGAFALLGIGFWLAYRQPASCAVGERKPTSRRPLQWTVWIAALIVCAMTVVAFTSQVLA
jgi:mercuric ion transport protein